LIVSLEISSIEVGNRRSWKDDKNSQMGLL